MGEMIYPLAAFLFSYYFVTVAGIPAAIKRALKRPGRMKPLDCVSCLSVWVCLLLLFLPRETSTIIACLFGAGFIGNKIK